MPSEIERLPDLHGYLKLASLPEQPRRRHLRGGCYRDVRRLLSDFDRLRGRTVM
jgi:hypothetical protein